MGFLECCIENGVQNGFMSPFFHHEKVEKAFKFFTFCVCVFACLYEFVCILCVLGTRGDQKTA